MSHRFPPTDLLCFQLTGLLIYSITRSPRVCMEKSGKRKRSEGWRLCSFLFWPEFIRRRASEPVALVCFLSPPSRDGVPKSTSPSQTPNLR